MEQHLSYSSISKLLRCARQYHYRYVLDMRAPPTREMAQSIAIHRAIQALFECRIVNARMLTREEQVVIYEAEFRRIFAEFKLDILGEEAALYEQGLALLDLHRAELAGLIEPRALEESFRISVHGIDVVGIWDVVTKDGGIVDVKVYAKVPSAEDVARDLQLSIYALAYRSVYGALPSYLALHVLTKTKRPKAHVLTTHRTEADLVWVEDLILQARRQIDAAVFPPNPTGWWCSREYCPYFEPCRGTGGNGSKPTGEVDW